MKYQISATAIFMAWLWIKHLYNEISKIIQPLIEEVERQAMLKDGKIDKSERKILVMRTITTLEAQGKIKLNFLTKLFLPKIVDIIASKLPDFYITSNASQLINDVKYKEIS